MTLYLYDQETGDYVRLTDLHVLVEVPSDEDPGDYLARGVDESSGQSFAHRLSAPDTVRRLRDLAMTAVAAERDTHRHASRTLDGQVELAHDRGVRTGLTAAHAVVVGKTFDAAAEELQEEFEGTEGNVTLVPDYLRLIGSPDCDCADGVVCPIQLEVQVAPDPGETIDTFDTDDSRAWAECCDTCQRYSSDEDAAKALGRQLGYEVAMAVPDGALNNRERPYLVTSNAAEYELIAQRIPKAPKYRRLDHGGLLA